MSIRRTIRKISRENRREIRNILGCEMHEYGVRITDWITAEPESVLESGSVICFVNKGVRVHSMMLFGRYRTSSRWCSWYANIPLRSYALFRLDIQLVA